jgi:hypothetical protein
MSLALAVNIIEDSGLKDVLSSEGVITQRGTRVAVVNGLTVGNANDAETALERAMAAVQAQFPRGKPYSSTKVASVVGWESVGIAQSDGSAKVRILYDIPIVPPKTSGGASSFIFSDSTETVNDTSQFFRDDISGQLIQLVIKYTDPNNNQIKKQMTATMSFERTIRRIVMSGVISPQSFAVFRKAANSVNDSTYLGLPRGFWRFKYFDDSTRDLGRSYAVQFEICADNNKDWSKYEVLRDRNTGQYVTVEAGLLNNLQKKPYSYGVIVNNGILKVGPYPTANFNSLFGTPKLP